MHGLILNIDSLNFIKNQNTAMAVCYKRNRDYPKQFNWTYKLKEDLYSCYIKAKEDPKLACMKRDA